MDAKDGLRCSCMQTESAVIAKGTKSAKIVRMQQKYDHSKS
jgi:hypothetical protein